MPGIIVSRPIFNTLFKRARDEGVSINAFLTNLLEKAGSETGPRVADATASANGSETAEGSAQDNGPTQFPAIGSNPDVSGESLRTASGIEDGDSDRPGEGVEIIGSEQTAAQANGHMPANVPGGSSQYRTSADRDYEDVPTRSSQAGGHRIGNSIWDKVVSMEGHRFATSRGKKFSYKVTGEYIVVRDSSARIPRSQFDKAQKMWPVSGPSHLVGVYAPSVVWAVMKEAIESEAAVT